MPIESTLFFHLSALLIFISSQQEYLFLNKYTSKNIFKEKVFSKDLIAARIVAEIKDEDSIFYLNTNLWTMLSISVIGSLFYFPAQQKIFNILSGLLLTYMIFQYLSLILKVKTKVKTNNKNSLNTTSIVELLDEQSYELKSKIVNPQIFSKATLSAFGFNTDSMVGGFGDLDINHFVDMSKNKTLAKFKYDEDIIFADVNQNLYEVQNFDNKDGKNPNIVNLKIQLTPLFTELNREVDISKKMMTSFLESCIATIVLYQTLIGLTLF